jgi:hypothetical protein
LTYISYFAVPPAWITIPIPRVLLAMQNVIDTHMAAFMPPINMCLLHCHLILCFKFCNVSERDLCSRQTFFVQMLYSSQHFPIPPLLLWVLQMTEVGSWKEGLSFRYHM